MKLSNLAEAKSQKYEIIPDSIETINGHKLVQIRALRNLGEEVFQGDPGGFIQSELNLSHKSNSWIYEGAAVYGPLIIDGNSVVHQTLDGISYDWQFSQSDINTLKHIPSANELSLYKSK